MNPQHRVGPKSIARLAVATIAVVLALVGLVSALEGLSSPNLAAESSADGAAALLLGIAAVALIARLLVGEEPVTKTLKLGE